jgi:dethiobiotin synthetase
MPAPESTGLFIAGTDTGVGKTYVTAATVRTLRNRGVPAIPLKPVQTGSGTGPDGEIFVPDLDFARRAAGLPTAADGVGDGCRYALAMLASPHLAAQVEGVCIELPDLVALRDRVLDAGGWPVLEGAGGLLVPLGPRLLQVDLIAALGLPVLLVARPGLGTLNHTLLSLECLDRRGIEVAGIALVEAVEGAWGGIEDDNLRVLQERVPAPVVRFPFVADPADPTAWGPAETALDPILAGVSAS